MLCVVTKDKRQNAGQLRLRKNYESTTNRLQQDTEKEIPPGAWMFVLCELYIEDKVRS